jgi:hypothetical protein
MRLRLAISSVRPAPLGDGMEDAIDRRRRQTVRLERLATAADLCNAI